MADYCTLTDVTDIIPSQVVGSNDGQVTEAQILRMITKKSGEIEHWNNDIPFEQTTVTDEYYEMAGLDRFALKRQPIISITSLSVQLSDATWEAQDEGRDPDTDDFFLAEAKWGLIRFHTTPSKGAWVKVTYVHGYATNPVWLRDLCAKMVAKDIFRLKVFDEECETLFRYWRGEIESYDRDIKKYRKRIERYRIMAKSFGARWATTPIDELTLLREWRR
jgi:hypothetical protein